MVERLLKEPKLLENLNRPCKLGSREYTLLMYALDSTLSEETRLIAARGKS